MEKPKLTLIETVLTEEDLKVIAEEGAPTPYTPEEADDIAQALEDGRSEENN